MKLKVETRYQQLWQCLETDYPIMMSISLHSIPLHDPWVPPENPVHSGKGCVWQRRLYKKSDLKLPPPPPPSGRLQAMILLILRTAILTWIFIALACMRIPPKVLRVPAYLRNRVFLTRLHIRIFLGRLHFRMFLTRLYVRLYLKLLCIRLHMKVSDFSVMGKLVVCDRRPHFTPLGMFLLSHAHLPSQAF